MDQDVANFGWVDLHLRSYCIRYKCPCLPDLTPLNWWKGHNGYLGSNAANILKGSDGQQFHPNVKETDDLRFVQGFERKFAACC